MDTPAENTKGKKVPKRLYVKIPKDFFTSSQAEQEGFADEIFDQFMAQFKQNNDQKWEEK